MGRQGAVVGAGRLAATPPGLPHAHCFSPLASRSALWPFIPVCRQLLPPVHNTPQFRSLCAIARHDCAGQRGARSLSTTCMYVRAAIAQLGRHECALGYYTYDISRLAKEQPRNNYWMCMPLARCDECGHLRRYPMSTTGRRGSATCTNGPWVTAGRPPHSARRPCAPVSADGCVMCDVDRAAYFCFCTNEVVRADCPVMFTAVHAGVQALNLEHQAHPRLLFRADPPKGPPGYYCVHVTGWQERNFPATCVWDRRFGRSGPTGASWS